MTREEAVEAASGRLLKRLAALKGISARGEWLERTLFSPAAEEAANQIRRWMKEAGMDVRYDALTNVIGLSVNEKADPEAPRIHVGSHYDTVINAGAYDGALGVLVAIGVVEAIRDAGLPLRHNLGALAFCDEEGVRFQTTFLGSAYLSGQFEKTWLDKADERGKTLGEWLVERAESVDELLAAEPVIRSRDYFLEAHIEQGPVLEAAGNGLGVFTRIAAQMRAEVELVGRAGHAGTTPARLRRDPLPAAGSMVRAVQALCRSDERMRATVGRFEVSPNASNVIPGRVRFTVDLRFPDAHGLRSRRDGLVGGLEAIADRSGLEFHYREVHWADDVSLDERATEALAEACAQAEGKEALRTCSGAGHDSMMVARACPTGMLAVRCREGLSHHPDEFVAEADCRLALKAMVEAVLQVDRKL